MPLNDLGWNECFARAFAELNGDVALVPGRVVRTHKGGYRVATEDGELLVKLSGRLRHEARSSTERPAVGDWVAVVRHPDGASGRIEAVLPRRTRFSRRTPARRGGLEEQVIVANIDVAFLVTGLDTNYNLRRIERYLTLARDSGAEAVVVLNKADVCDDTEDCVAAVRAVAREVPVVLTSAVTGRGLEALRERLGPGRTATFLGSSGVGKSTLINALLGEERQAIAELSESAGKGRHTTTARELIPLPAGGALIDTPGLRELQIWCEQDALDESFAEILELAAQCRFRDCRHDAEPGCAVQAALDEGTLDPERFFSYQRQNADLDEIRRMSVEREKILGRTVRRRKAPGD